MTPEHIKSAAALLAAGSALLAAGSFAAFVYNFKDGSKLGREGMTEGLRIHMSGKDAGKQIGEAALTSLPALKLEHHLGDPGRTWWRWFCGN